MSIVVIRTIVLYLTIVLALRIMGKRQLGELQPAELVVTILVSNIATLSIEDTNIQLLGSILPIFTLVSCEVLISVICLKSKKARHIISGNPRIVIRNGEIDQQELKNLRWSLDDLTEQLRQGGYFDIREVGFAIVETAGTLSVYPKFGARPVTAEQMQIPPDGTPDTPPMTIISDGDIDDNALTFLNLRRPWLDKILAEKEIKASDVFLMTCDRCAAYEITLKDGAKQ